MNPAMHALPLLLIEDHEVLRELISDCLTQAGYQVVAVDCAESLAEVKPVQWFAAILDINLPGEDGLSLAKRLRTAQPNLRIAMLTARNAVQDRVTAYDVGADVYLNKPFEAEELLAILTSWAKRQKQSLQQQMACRLLREKLLLDCDSATCEVTAGEARVLQQFALAPDHQLAYWQLLELLNWPMDDENLHRLRNKMYKLRKKIASLTQDQNAIKALRGDGYKLNIPIIII